MTEYNNDGLKMYCGNETCRTNNPRRTISVHYTNIRCLLIDTDEVTVVADTPPQSGCEQIAVCGEEMSYLKTNFRPDIDWLMNVVPVEKIINATMTVEAQGEA